jgi:hypothetical protein
MPSTPIEFPQSSFPSHFDNQPSESQGRLLNTYVEQESQQSVYKRIPGTKFFADTLVSHPRGMMEADGYVYGAYEDCVIKIGPDGVATQLTGELPGIDRCTWAKNNALATPPRDMVVVCEAGAFEVTPEAVTPYPGSILPSNPTSTCHLDGYIFFTFPDGKIYATGLNTLGSNLEPPDDADIDAQSFTTAESNPDGLLRGIVSGRQLFAMGAASIEVYQNVGTSPFPLSRAAVIPVGLIGTFAAAGGNETDGWDSPPLFVAADGTVRQFSGYDPKIVSTRTVERFIAAQPNNGRDITAYVYTFLGNSVFGIKGNGANPDERCFEYNTSTGQWHERQSQGYFTWRGHRTVWAFGRWLVGDVGSTHLRFLDANAQGEDRDQIPCRIESKCMKNFPDRLAIPRADFMFAQGVGHAVQQDPIQTDPVTEISWSNDGGGTWSRPLRRALGQQGEFGWDVRINRTGMTTKAGRRWRVDVSDPVAFVFLGATMDVEQRTT